MIDPAKLVRISVDDMLAEWALAERHEWKNPPKDLCRKIEIGEVLTPSERDEAIRLFAQIERRGPEVTFFRQRGADWYATEFRLRDLGGVHLHMHWARSHWSTAGSTTPLPGTVAEFATRPDLPRGFNSDGHPDPRSTYRPIYVATGLGGPWHIAEGSHRSHAIWKAYERGDGEHRDTFAVIVGVHPNMDAWWNFVG